MNKLGQIREFKTPDGSHFFSVVILNNNGAAIDKVSGDLNQETKSSIIERAKAKAVSRKATAHTINAH